MSKIKLALLSGGVSGEREVSLKTGEQIFGALDKSKYEITKYDPKTDLKQFVIDAIDKKFDLIFPALHGPFGEDGKLQGMLDMIGVPYVFSGCLSSALAMNKHKTKIQVNSIGINIAKDKLIKKNENIDMDEIIHDIELPIVIKPIELGSSVGMSIAKTKEELQSGLEEAFKHDSTVLLEQFIKGRELTVPVMGNNPPKALPVIEIIPKISEWFDFKAKYEVGGTEEVCPASVPDEVKNKLQEMTLAIYKEIGCKDISRADFIWDEKNNNYYFLEINTIPGMTETSLVPQSAKAAGMEFSDFLNKLISFNLK